MKTIYKSGRSIYRDYLRFVMFSVAVISVFVLAFMSCTIFTAKAEEVENTGSVALSARVAENLSVAVTSDNLAFDIIPTPQGTFESKSVSVTAGTNAYEYRLYFADKDEDNDLVSLANPAKRFAHLETDVAVTAPDYTEFPVNHWGYALDGSSTFKAIPLASHPLLLQEESGGTPVAPRTSTLTFGVKADNNITAGVYTDTVSLIAYAISEPNVDTLVIAPSTAEGTITGGTFEMTITLPLDYVSGLSENMWDVTVGGKTCENVVAAMVDGKVQLTCDSPRSFKTGTYTVQATNPNYGIYTGTIKFEGVDFYSIAEMQEMTETICKTVRTPANTVKSGYTVDTTGENSDVTLSGTHTGTNSVIPEITLKDNRDGKEYLVRKLADGNCWMAQNLEFDFKGTGNTDYYRGDTSSATAADQDSANYAIADSQTNGLVSGSLNITPENTDINSGADWAAISARTKVYTTMTNTLETNSAASYKKGWKNNGSDGMRSYSYHASKPDGSWDYSYRTGTSSGMATFSSKNSGEPYQRYGNLYNWTAATLGSGLSISSGETDAQDSICPKGWRLPPNSGNRSWYNLIHDVYGQRNSYTATDNQFPSSNNTANPDFNNLDIFPYALFRAGYYSRSYGYIYSRVAYGLWWSSTTSDANAHYLYTYTGRIRAQYANLRGNGFSVRCVSRAQ